MKKFRVHVKQEHIDNGVERSPKWCPIANALRDVGVIEPHVNYAMVHHGYGGLGNKLKWSDFFPKHVECFIKSFDEHGAKHCKPFTFEMCLKGLP